jgi:putative peptidoglycan lipid II flippase
MSIISKNFFSTIAGASVIITLVTLISRLFGFVREVLFANYYGLSDAFELYLIGAVIPISINSALVYIAQNYFIPEYHKERKKGSEILFFNKVLFSFFIGGFLISIFLYLFSDLLMGMFIDKAQLEKFTIVKNIFHIFLITIPLNSAVYILIGYLNVKYDFINPSVSFLLLNIFFLIVLYFLQSNTGIYTIPLAFVIGTLIQLLFLIKKIFHLIDVKAIKKISIKNNFINKHILTLIAIEIVGQLFIFMDRIFYKSVEPGGIAALNYAMTLYVMPISIISFSLLSVVFPKIADLYSENSIEDLISKIKQVIGVNILFYIPITAIFLFYGDTIIKLLYERGAFTELDTSRTYSVLFLFTISLTFYATYSIINKYFYSKGSFLQVLKIISISLCIKIILNLILVDKFQSQGLALSTTISFIVLFLLSIFLFNKAIKHSYSDYLLRYGTINILNALFSLVLVYLFSSYSNVGAVYQIALFTIIYFSNSYFINDNIIKLIISSLSRSANK